MRCTIYETFAAACRAFCEAGFEFRPLYYASGNPRHDAGCWFKGAGPVCHTAERAEGGWLVWCVG